MKNIFLCFLMLFSLAGCNNKKETLDVSVSASSYVVIEQSTNKILEGFNYNYSRSVASISKIMTAIIVIENVDLEKEMLVNDEIKKVDGSSIYLKIGEKIKVIDLLYGLLLRSGNDAAIMLSLSVSNNINHFINLMNEKAYELKMNNTVFSNPHGLDVNDNGNISSALDMAILYSYCLENEIFREITSSKSYKNFANKNKLLKNYEYCTGGKTGILPS